MNLRNLLLSLILLCISLGLIAAEENKQEDEKTKQQESSKVKSTPGKRAQIKTLEEFVPSEEVSADKAVAFPSDI